MMMKKLVSLIKPTITCIKLLWEASRVYFIARLLITLADTGLPFITIYLSKRIIDILASNYNTSTSAN